MTTTYSTNDDIQKHVPFEITEISRPTSEAIDEFRSEVYELIKVRVPTASTTGALKTLEINKVLMMIDNYYARGRGDRTEPIIITEDDLRILQLSTQASTYGGGHYSVEVP